MTEDQKTAFVMSKCVTAFAQISGMVAFNKKRELLGLSPGYDEESFLSVIEELELEPSKVLELFNVKPSG